MKFNLLKKIKHKFRKEEKPYQLKKISPIKKAKAMDLVLELCMKYYIDNAEKIDFYKVENRLYSKLGLHSWESDFLLDIMVGSGYIKEKFKKNKDLEYIFCTPKGIKVFIDGGFEIDAKRKINERRLIRIAQLSSVIIGLYYLAISLKEYLIPLYELLMNLIYSVNSPQ